MFTYAPQTGSPRLRRGFFLRARSPGCGRAFRTESRIVRRYGRFDAIHPPSFDFFQFYRFVLTAFVVVYAGLSLIDMIRRWIIWTSGDRRLHVLRRYATVLLLRTPSAAFLPPLLSLLPWLAALVILIRLHP